MHRCLAAGLLECPQYTKQESLCVTQILDGACCSCAAQLSQATPSVRSFVADTVVLFDSGIQAALETQPAPIAAPKPVFAGQLPSVPSAALKHAMTDPSTPMDIKMGLTEPGDVAHPLRWGFMTAGRICKDMVGFYTPPPPPTAAAVVSARCWSCCVVFCCFVALKYLRNGCVALFCQAQACLIAAGRGCGAVLGAVSARKLEDAEAFAAELGCEKAYGGDSAYADMCADPDIDICYVGTVRSAHVDAALPLCLCAVHGPCSVFSSG